MSSIKLLTLIFPPLYLDKNPLENLYICDTISPSLDKYVSLFQNYQDLCLK